MLMPKHMQVMLRGGIKKKTVFFFRKTPKGGEGGLAESKISLSEKTEIFLEFFLQRGGVSPIPKGCYHKKMGIFGYCRQKGESHSIHRDFIIPKFPYQKKLGLPNCWKGEGSQNFGVFLKKKNIFFMPPLSVWNTATLLSYTGLIFFCLHFYVYSEMF